MFSSLEFPYKILNYFMDAMVGPDFETGLINFKNYIESIDFEKISPKNVQIVNEFGVDYALVRKDSLAMRDMNSFFKSSYPLVYDYLRSKGVEPKGPSTGIYYAWDEINFVTDLAAAVPISELLPEESESIDFEFGAGFQTNNSISCELKGGYSKSYAAHTAINDWLEENNKIMDGPVIEEYVKGPNDTKDSSDYLTRITYHFLETASN
jgi:effector-binding domain-containing protein